MLSLKEYRILKILRENHYRLEDVPVIMGGFKLESEHNEIVRRYISDMLHIHFDKVETIIQYLGNQGYLDCKHYLLTNDGLIAIEKFPRDVLKSVFTVYLPIAISIAALIISIFF